MGAAAGRLAGHVRNSCNAMAATRLSSRLIDAGGRSDTRHRDGKPASRLVAGDLQESCEIFASGSATWSIYYEVGLQQDSCDGG